MKVCKYCEQDLNLFSNAGGHVVNCSLNPALQMVECSFCGQKIVKRSLKNHEIHCKSNPISIVRIIFIYMKMNKYRSQYHINNF